LHLRLHIHLILLGASLADCKSNLGSTDGPEAVNATTEYCIGYSVAMESAVILPSVLAKSDPSLKGPPR
jgi:hypothetical protein